MLDYEVTASGAAFIENALRVCRRFGVTWSQLWNETSWSTHQARLALSDYEKLYVIEGAEVLLGAVAVIQVLREVSLGMYELTEGVSLLKAAHLLSEKNIAVAAETFGISEAQVRDLLS